MGLWSKQSSANRRTVDCTDWGRSLICKRNRRGPKTVPCGTPDSTLALLEVWLSTTTHRTCDIVFPIAANQYFNLTVAGPIPQKTYRSRLVSSFIENTVNCKIHTKAIVTIFIVIKLH